MKRTYIQVKDNGGTWRLIVQVTEKASDNQREATHTICTAMMQDMGIGKEPLLATRKDIYSGLEMFNGIQVSAQCLDQA